MDVKVDANHIWSDSNKTAECGLDMLRAADVKASLNTQVKEMVETF